LSSHWFFWAGTLSLQSIFKNICHVRCRGYRWKAV
jgi:hypothetical protein